MWSNLQAGYVAHLTLPLLWSSFIHDCLQKLRKGRMLASCFPEKENQCHRLKEKCRLHTFDLTERDGGNLAVLSDPGIQASFVF